jgi:hypothetical protein
MLESCQVTLHSARAGILIVLLLQHDHLTVIDRAFAYVLLALHDAYCRKRFTLMQLAGFWRGDKRAASGAIMPCAESLQVHH